MVEKPDTAALLSTKNDGTTSTKEVLDFAQALGHNIFETPVVGFTQAVNHASGLNLPELNIIGQPKDGSLGATAGTIAGLAVDYVVAAKAGNAVLGNFGGSGKAGNALRAGIVGGVYSGLLMPSDSASNSFFKDRLANAAVGGLTFAGMAAASDALALTGKFAVPEVRSLTGSIAMGAASGIAGGAVHSEANTIFKDGKALPSMTDFLSDTASYAAFGAVTGAGNFAWNKYIAPPKVTEVTSTITSKYGEEQPAQLKLTQNAQGDVVKMQANLPARNSSFSRVGWVSTMMTDGSWSDKGYEILDNSWYRGGVQIPDMKGISIGADGQVKVESTNGELRTFDNGGKYTRSNPKAEAEAAARASKLPSWDWSNYVDDAGVRHLNLSESSNTLGAGSSSVAVKDGIVDNASIRATDGGQKVSLSMQRTDGDNWAVTATGNDGAVRQYTWKGDIKPNQNAKGGADNFVFKGATATDATVVKGEDGNSMVNTFKSIIDQAKFTQVSPNWRYVRVDDSGKLFMRPGLGTINGAAGTMDEVAINPGDKIELKFDIGDRGPNIKTVPVTWTRSLDGNTVLFNGTPLTPGTVLGLGETMTKDLFSPY